MSSSRSTITHEYYEKVVNRESAREADYAADRILLKLSKLRAPQPGDSIIDIGCGTGVITAAFARRGFEAHGIDVVPEFVEVARARHPSLSIVLGAAEALPFPDATFDFANLSSLLEHVEDWRGALREAARVLRPGGVLYLSTSNRLWPFQDEIAYFPGFGYLPRRLQRRIYAWAMQHRPSLVGHTHLPAYHWLTYWQIARELKGLRLEPHSWLQLIDDDDIPTRARKYKRLIMAISRSRVPLYPFLRYANLIVALKSMAQPA